MEEQIADSVLLDVFNQIKGPTGDHRSFVTIEDFTAAVIRYQPVSINEQTEARVLGGKALKDFVITVEDLFRNICETVSPVITNDSKAGNDRDSMLGSEDMADLGTKTLATPQKKLKKKPEPSYLRSTTNTRAKQREKSPMATSPKGGKTLTSPRQALTFKSSPKQLSPSA